MEAIKFRAKSLSTGEWMHGSHFNDCGEDYIIPNTLGAALDYEDYQCNQNTVGQFIGLTDKNGKDIYEGDIVKCKEFVYTVKYSKRFASFCLCRRQDMFLHYFGEAVEASDVEVIGNIHDNPEILEQNGND